MLVEVGRALIVEETTCKGIDPWNAVIHCNTFVMNDMESVRAGYKVGDIDYLALKKNFFLIN